MSEWNEWYDRWKMGCLTEWMIWVDRWKMELAMWLSMIISRYDIWKRMIWSRMMFQQLMLMIIRWLRKTPTELYDYEKRDEDYRWMMDSWWKNDNGWILEEKKMMNDELYSALDYLKNGLKEIPTDP